jgi:acyl-CoA synthetase (AMP-forming)/AMP-acid ligase II
VVADGRADLSHKGRRQSGTAAQGRSYAAFLATAARFAHVLRARGLTAPGDRLAAQIHKSPEALALYAACAQAGIIFLPLNTAYTVDELSYFIENSGARMVVCDEAPRGAHPGRRPPRRRGPKR